MIEWFRLEEALKISRTSLLPWAGTLSTHPGQSSPIQPGINSPRDEASTFSGQPVPHHPHSKKIPPYIQPKSPFLQSEPIALCPSIRVLCYPAQPTCYTPAPELLLPLIPMGSPLRNTILQQPYRVSLGGDCGFKFEHHAILVTTEELPE